ncbi:glycosyltransferase [Brenneria sp. 4F2]|nr:glycosyltransferase [Brenneria bubanii]
MNILYVSHIAIDHSNGVWKKIKNQVNSLKGMGHNVDFTYFTAENKLAYLRDDEEEIFTIPHRYLYLFFLKKNVSKKYDVIYIRKPHGGFYPLFMSSFLKKMKSIGTKSIYLEIPTYPFKNESSSVKGKVSDFVFDTEMLLAKKHIDKIFTIGKKVNNLYNIDTYNIINGVDLDEVNLVSKAKKENNTINFVGIANLSYWHGYDRLIQSLKSYDGNDNINFYIIGDTEPELSRLKKIAEDADIPNGHVIFLGRKTNSEINSIISNMDICVDSLGRHRSGNNFNSSIKSKEYTAMGMPFILSHIDDAYAEGVFFKYQCSADENIIDINDIVQWYKSLPTNFNEAEREYANEHFSWKKIFKNIL